MTHRLRCSLSLAFRVFLRIGNSAWQTTVARGLLVCAAVALSSCTKQNPAPADSRLSSKEFTEEYGKFLKGMHPEVTVEVRAPLELRVIPKDGTERVAFLDNAFREYQSAPENKAEIFARFAKTASEPEAGKLSPDRIAPIIKDRAWIKEVTESLAKAHPSSPTVEYVFDDFNEALIVVYAQDLGERLAYLTPKDLEEAKIDRSKLRELATANLKTLITESEARGGDGVYMLTAGGTYEASLLLSEKLWNAPPFELKGEPVVAIPTRDVLLVTGSGDREGLRRIKAQAETLHKEGSYQLTPQLFVWRGGKFQIWKE